MKTQRTKIYTTATADQLSKIGTKEKVRQAIAWEIAEAHMGSRAEELAYWMAVGKSEIEPMPKGSTYTKLAGFLLRHLELLLDEEATDIEVQEQVSELVDSIKERI